MIWYLISNDKFSDFLKSDAVIRNADGTINICDAKHAKPKNEPPSHNFFLVSE